MDCTIIEIFCCIVFFESIGAILFLKRTVTKLLRYNPLSLQSTIKTIKRAMMIDIVLIVCSMGAIIFNTLFLCKTLDDKMKHNSEYITDLTMSAFIIAFMVPLLQWIFKGCLCQKHNHNDSHYIQQSTNIDTKTSLNGTFATKEYTSMIAK